MKKENLSKFYQKYRLYIFPAVVTLASLFLIIFAIIPQTFKLISNQKDEGDLRNKSQFLESKVEALESYDALDLSNKLQFALNAYPGSTDFGLVIGLLQQITVRSGFILTTISLGSVSANLNGSQSYELKMELAGVKPNLPILLNNLESSTRLIRVGSIDVSTRASEGKITVNLVVQVLYSAVPKTFGDTDSPLPEISQKDQELLTRLARTGVTQSSSVSTPRGKANPFE